MLQVIDPGRAVLAAGVVIAVGIALFLYRNREDFRRRLRGEHE